MIKFNNKGNLTKTINFLEKARNSNFYSKLESLAKEGVTALSLNTPIDSGKTSESWDYNIESQKGKIVINWTNSNVNDGVNIALIIQYGHGTGTGGYVEGIDYINSALAPIFDRISNEIWKEVSSK